MNKRNDRPCRKPVIPNKLSEKEISCIGDTQRSAMCMRAADVTAYYGKYSKNREKPMPSVEVVVGYISS